MTQWMFALLAVAACSSSQPTSGTTVDVSAAPEATTTTPISSQRPNVLGTWSSPSCNKRNYERVIIINEGKFAADDRVSPCPPGTQCVWSGIVHRTGTYKWVGPTIALLPDDAIEGKQAGEPFPSTLAAVGAGLEDDYGCAYSKRP